MPLIPDGLTRTAHFSWPLPGGVASWLTRISAPSLADSASIWRSRARLEGSVRSSAMLLSPQTIRSGLAPASRPSRLSCAVSAWDACVRRLGLRTTPGCTIATVSCPAPTLASTPAAPAIAGRVRPAAPGARTGPSRGSDSASSTTATFAITSAMLISLTPPTAASASTAGCCHWLTPYTAHGPPSACQDRSHSVSSQQLGTTTSAASARSPLAGGRSSVRAATPNGTHITPNTAPTSSTAGPISGAIQYSAAMMYPAPNHQPRTPPSRAVGDLMMSSSPGTSPNHASHSRFGSGNESTGSAPASSISRRGDHSHRPAFRRTLPTLSIVRQPRRSATRRVRTGGARLTLSGDRLPRARRRAVAADDLAAGAAGLAGPVGMHDQPPAQPVQQDVVVPVTGVFEPGEAGVAAVAAVHHVVRLAAGGGLVAAAGEPAALVAQRHQPPQVHRDLVRLADVQRQRGAIEAFPEQVAAQEGRDPARAGDDLEHLGQDLLLQHRHDLGVRPGPVLPVRVVRPGCAAVVSCGGLDPDPVIFDAHCNQIFDGGWIDVAGDHGHGHGVAHDGSGGVAVQPGPAVAGADRSGGPRRGPPRPVVRDPLVLEHGSVVQVQEFAEVDVHEGLDRLADPLRQ